MFYNLVMIKIRRLNCFDYSKLKKLISYLCEDDSDKLAQSLMEEPLGLFNALIPLAFKFKSESFILIKDNEISGLITIVPTSGNPYKINITKLIFKENEYEIGKMLVDFVIQKFGAKGAHTFVVMIDECHDELFDLFINGVGFRQCSSETLWKNDRPIFQKTGMKFRNAQNSDSEAISQLYNSEINSMYKPSLERNKKEFQEAFFQGFKSFYKSRYVLESEQNLLGYFSVTTSDNINYILDITTNSGYCLDYDDIIDTMLSEIASKKRAFYPLVKQKKYTNEAQRLGDYLKSKNYYPIQTQHILVKDFYKPVKEYSSGWKVFTLGESQASF